MPSLADLPELIGFFSYSREDDADSQGSLTALRNRIQAELRGQLGRTAKSFRLWQDKEAIPSGSLWETEIKNAVGQAVFFIPIITPTVVASPYCKFELGSFIAREAALGREDLVFPILYIDVPGLEDDTRRENDSVLSLIASRQYVDWRDFRYLDVNSTDVRRAVGRFCADIRNALYRSWTAPFPAPQSGVETLQQTVPKPGNQEIESQSDVGVATPHKSEAAAAQVSQGEAAAKPQIEENDHRQRKAEADQTTGAESLKAAARVVHVPQPAEREAIAPGVVEDGKRIPPSSSPSPAWRRLWPAVLIGCLVFAVLVAGIVGWIERSGPAPLSLAQEQALKPHDTFQECSQCPQMIVVPAGSFTMGSPASEAGRDVNEGPQHKVTIAKAFAVAKFDVRRVEFSAFVDETGYDAGSKCFAWDGKAFVEKSDTSWRNPGYTQTDSDPVTCVSWTAAQAYVNWLHKKTGQDYRLLSEAEWEYAARAGTTTVYYWGDIVGVNNADCNGCGSQWDAVKTAPVGSFAANPFGLYDMAGNAIQWVADCWNVNYTGAPADGSAWTSGNCSGRIARTGSYDDYPSGLRSAMRREFWQSRPYFDIGFRVARTLRAR
jgi:formylglycine-generating enzyme required for sulfatase activity